METPSESLIVSGRHSGALFSVLLLLVIAVASFSYYKFIVRQDFLVYAQVSCDPATEECFVQPCVPNEEGTCASEEDDYYYKIIQKPARTIPICNPQNEQDCPELACEEGDALCEVVYCSPDNALLYSETDYCE